MRSRGLLPLLAVAACQGRSGPVTGLRVAATWAGGTPDQLSYALAGEDGSPIGAPELRPAQPGGPLASGVSVVVYLGDERGGQRIQCAVEALERGRVIGAGSASTLLARRQVVDLVVALAPSMPAGGPPDGGEGAVVATATDAAPQPVDLASTDVGQPSEPVAPIVPLPPPPPPDAGAVDRGSEVVDVASDGKVAGTRCQASEECASGHCVDGVCCVEECVGACRSCAGTQPGICTTSPAGALDPRGLCRVRPPGSCDTSGLCDGSGSCSYHPAGTACGTGSCDPVANTRQPAPTCNGKGACDSAAAVSCAPYRCAGPGCADHCAGDADCLSPAVCQGGVCRGPGPVGAPCGGPAHCQGGHCVDGVCCGVASCPTCQVCNLAGFAGTCKDAPSGTPCASTCSNGYYSGPDNKCDGRGRCRSNNSVSCLPYVCNPNAAACYTACATSAQCCCGRRCEAGKCI